MLSCTVPQIHWNSVKAKGPGSVETAEDQASSDHHTLSTEWAHGVRSDLSSWMNDGSSKRVIYCTDVCMLYCWFHSLLSDLHTHQHKTHLTRNKSTTTKSFYVFIPTSMKGNLIFIHINSLKTCEHTQKAKSETVERFKNTQILTQTLTCPSTRAQHTVHEHQKWLNSVRTGPVWGPMHGSPLPPLDKHSHNSDYNNTAR